MRRIELQGADNVRELGGMKTGDHLVIEKGRLIRSNKLSKLSEEDVRILKEKHQLHTIIDLRTELEIREEPDVEMKGVTYLAIPLMEEKAMGLTREKATDDMLSLIENVPDMPVLYSRLVAEKNAGKWKRIFDVIFENQEGAVLWHCTAGKDRCGLVAAMVAYALGVSLEDIEEDYLETNKTAEKNADQICDIIFQKTGDEQLSKGMKKLFVARKEYLEAAFDRIEVDFGSLDGFLEDACGLDEGKRKRLRENYCN